MARKSLSSRGRLPAPLTGCSLGRVVGLEHTLAGSRKGYDLPCPRAPCESHEKPSGVELGSPGSDTQASADGRSLPGTAVPDR